LRELEDVIGSTLSLRSSGEDCSAVASQHLQPALQITRMAELAVDPAMGALILSSFH
jgi:hypothetical protein